MAVLETTFVIDLMKESKRRIAGPASRKLEELTARGELLRIAVFTLAELFVGVTKGTRPRQERAAIEQCVAPFEVLPFERSTAEIFGLWSASSKKEAKASPTLMRSLQVLLWSMLISW